MTLDCVFTKSVFDGIYENILNTEYSNWILYEMFQYFISRKNTKSWDRKKVSVGKGAEAEPLPKKVSTTPCPLQLKSQTPFISPFIRPKGFISPPPFCSFFEMFQVPPCWGCMLTSKKVVSITIKYFDWVFKHFGDYDQWIWSFENSSSS